MLPIAAHIISLMSRSPLLRIESLLRRIVEEPFTAVRDAELDPYALAGMLLRHLGDESREEIGEIRVRIDPELLPEDNEGLAVLQESVLSYLELLAVRTGQPLLLRPSLTLVPDATVAGQAPRISVMAAEPGVVPPSTAAFVSPERSDIGKAIQAADAFLIVQGRQHVPLHRPVVRIGRRVDNDIVLDSSTVSRYHAQLQWRDNGYVLFDTSTHGRTWVNGLQVQEQRLESGDVIGLSDILLVYGEGRQAADLPADGDEGPPSDTLLGP